MAQATQEARREKIDSYITDMLALEEHIRTALAGQIADLEDQDEFKGTLVRLHAVSAVHIERLEALVAGREQNAGGVSKVVKKVASSVLGLGAAVVDFVRTEKLPKDLRDDYTALSLAYIGYLMLHTTALTLHDVEVATLARTAMGEQAESMMTLQKVIPAATIAFLASEGLDVDRAVLSEIDETISNSWR